MTDHPSLLPLGLPLHQAKAFSPSFSRPGSVYTMFVASARGKVSLAGDPWPLTVSSFPPGSCAADTGALLGNPESMGLLLCGHPSSGCPAKCQRKPDSHPGLGVSLQNLRWLQNSRSRSDWHSPVIPNLLFAGIMGRVARAHSTILNQSKHLLCLLGAHCTSLSHILSFAWSAVGVSILALNYALSLRRGEVCYPQTCFPGLSEIPSNSEPSGSLGSQACESLTEK